MAVTSAGVTVNDVIFSEAALKVIVASGAMFSATASPADMLAVGASSSSVIS